MQIAFTYKGEQCRELLPAARLNKGYVEYAAGLRAEIRRKIKDGEFSYRAYFPNSQMASKLEPGGEVPEAAKLLMATLLNRQKALYEKQAENSSISASTLLGYAKIITNVLIPRWGRTPLPELTPADLRQWISGLGVTGKTVRNIMTPLRSVLDDAVNDELIAVNPLERIALGKLIKQTARKSDYVPDPFDAREVEALIAAARGDERPTVEFWFDTGLRPGELIAFPWPSVDWINGRARIDHNIVTGMVGARVERVAKAPKTEAGIRDVDLSPRAFAALNVQKAYTFLAGGRVFHNPRTGEPWSSDEQLRKILWEPLCKRAGVRYRNPYQVRHTFASTRLTAGANPWYIADQMGHVDVEMVFKTYGKFIPANFKQRDAFTRESHQPLETVEVGRRK